MLALGGSRWRFAKSSTSAGGGSSRRRDGDIDVIDSRTEDVMGSVPRGGGPEVERAVAAARAAFPAWSRTSVPERAAALRAIADGLEARSEQLAETMSREVGTPIATSRRVQVGLSVDVFRSVADILADFPMETRIGNSLLIRQPAGVVAAITPWNYPLYQLAAKLAPALAAGCTTILKPASAAPLAAFVLAEIIDELGLPPGTVNVISGPGSEIGEMLAGHPGVDMVSITGSTQAGVRVAQAAAQTVKRVTLELGGKSPFILLDDTDLAAALPVAVRSCFVNNGQTCSALTRLIVPRELMPAVAEGLADLVGAMRVGDPLDPGVRPRPDGDRGSATDRLGLHRARPCRRRDPRRRRRRRPRGPRSRVLRPAYRVFCGLARHGDRPGGDLRAGPRRDSRGQRRRGRADRERL